MNRRRWITHYVLATLLCAPGLALAQGARIRGMGGVVVPANAGGVTPASAAADFSDGSTYVPLPLGLLNFLVNDRLDPGSEQRDLLAVLEQVTNLDTFIFNPSRSPEEIIFSVGPDEDGNPTIAIAFLGGSTLQLVNGPRTTFEQGASVPLGFRAGPVVVGLRTYVEAGATLTADADLLEVFGVGAAGGKLDAVVSGEAGTPLDGAGAFALPIPQTDDFPGTVYVGVRGAPFLGLAKVRANATGTVSAALAGSDITLTYDYSGDGFFSSVTEGQVGFGLLADVGAAVAIEVEGGEAFFGVSVRNFGIEVWPVRPFTFTGDNDNGDTFTPGTPTSRAFFAEDIALFVNGAFAVDADTLAAPPLDGVLIAADAGVEGSGLTAHLGVEAELDLGQVQVFGRAGAGIDNGAVFGIGTGFRAGPAGLDLALHSFSSPLTTHRSLGASVSLVFGF